MGNPNAVHNIPMEDRKRRKLKKAQKVEQPVKKFTTANAARAGRGTDFH
jgi:hypothetical protein